MRGARARALKKTRLSHTVFDSLGPVSDSPEASDIAVVIHSMNFEVNNFRSYRQVSESHVRLLGVMLTIVIGQTVSYPRDCHLSKAVSGQFQGLLLIS